MPVPAFDLLLLVGLPVLLCCSAFFSASETALFSLTAHERTRLSQTSGPVAGALVILLRETRALLITLLLGNMTVNVLFFVFSSMLLIRMGKRWDQPSAIQASMLAGATLVPLLAVILLGEVMPKIIAARISMRWSRLAALPLLLIHRLLSPIRIVASSVVITPLAHLIAPRQKPPELSAEELESLLDLSQQHGVIDADEEQLLQQVLELSQLKVSDLITPRVDVVAFDLGQKPVELVSLAKRTKHSLIIAHRGGLDAVEGIIHRRQVLLHPPGSRLEVHALVRPAVFIPEQQRADRLIDEFRRLQSTLAVVVDEYGGTTGVIALSDVINHMTGGLRAPNDDTQGPGIVQVVGGHWRVDADLSIHDWPDWFGRGQKLGLDADRTGISTIGGLVMARLGRVPRTGDTTTFGNVRFTVRTMAGMRIREVDIQLAEAPADEAGGEA